MAEYRGSATDHGGLRGRILIWDFWTFCCINCLHVLEELRPIEQKYQDTVVVIGVHSPNSSMSRIQKLWRRQLRGRTFSTRARDPDLSTWQQYAVRAWPTLVVIDLRATSSRSFRAKGMVTRWTGG